MGAEVGPPLKEPGYAASEVTKLPSWHGLVAWDLLFNNLATGLFLMTAICELALPGAFSSLARVAYPIALGLLLTDLLLLVLDLGDPLRFHHMLRVFKLYSPMSFGTWSLTLFSMVLSLIVAIEMLETIGFLPHDSAGLEGFRKVAVAVGLLPALGSISYKGVLFSTSSQPAWKDARWLGGYMINSALVLGCAQMMAVAVLTGRDRAADLLRPALALLLGLNLIPLGLLIADVREPIARALAPRQRILAAAMVLGVGTLIPMCSLLLGSGRWLMLAAAAFILLGSVLVRYLIIGIPHALREHPARAEIAGSQGTKEGTSIGRAGEDA
jgi:Polysulphide reductase, NrfD